jgi:hypothetical protein
MANKATTKFDEQFNTDNITINNLIDALFETMSYYDVSAYHGGNIDLPIKTEFRRKVN